MTEATSKTASIDDHPTRIALRPLPALFVVLHGSTPLAAPSRHLLSGIDTIRIGRGEGARTRATRIGAELTLGIPDPAMSSHHAVLRRRAPSGFLLEDLGSKNGTFVVDGRENDKDARIERSTLLNNDAMPFVVGRTLLLFRAAVPLDPKGLPPDVDAADLTAPHPLLGTLLPELALTYDLVRIAAPATIPVAVFGETGTGKEVVAQAIHTLSKRSGRFVALNCAALPPTLVVSELFGYRKGAFSGAEHDHPGLFRAADRGTLLLDEIGDFPLAAQATLLRALQEKEVTPLGTTKPIKIDVRIVAATHQDLRALVRRGTFREDLLGRLCGLVVSLPPVRARREDLGLLVGEILLRISRSGAARATFAASALRALILRAFSGNVRELEHVLTTALAIATEGPITEEVLESIDRARLHDGLPDLPEEEEKKDADPDSEAPSDSVMASDRELRARLVASFAEHGGNVSAVARSMGKARFQIQRWMRRLKIDPRDPT